MCDIAVVGLDCLEFKRGTRGAVSLSAHFGLTPNPPKTYPELFQDTRIRRLACTFDGAGAGAIFNKPVHILEDRMEEFEPGGQWRQREGKATALEALMCSRCLGCWGSQGC